LLAIYALNTALQYVVTYWGHMLGINIETDMRRKLYDHIQKLSFRFFRQQQDRPPHRPRHHRPAGYRRAGPPRSRGCLHRRADACWARLFSCSDQLAVGAADLPGCAHHRLGGHALQPQDDPHLSPALSRSGQFNARIEESIGGIRVVKAFANEDYERELFAVDNASYRDTKLIAYKIMARSISLSYMLMRFVLMFVMVAGTWFVIQDAVDLR
jgi:ATP-binding cassette subfamily B protein